MRNPVPRQHDRIRSANGGSKSRALGPGMPRVRPECAPSPALKQPGARQRVGSLQHWPREALWGRQLPRSIPLRRRARLCGAAEDVQLTARCTRWKVGHGVCDMKATHC